MQNFLAFWTFSDDSPDLLEARMNQLMRQIPLMYAIVGINIVVIASMTVGHAPPILTIGIPTFFWLTAIVRSVAILKTSKGQATPAANRKKLATVLVFAVILGILLCCWAGLLFQYGDAYLKGQVAFFVGVTVVGVVTCLMPLRQAPAIMLILIVAPWSAFLWMQPEMHFRAISVNMFLVSLSIFVVFWRAHNDFVGVHQQKLELQKLNDTVTDLANHDSLTGLPNRRRFFDYLENELKDGARFKNGFAVAILDLDGFKPINDVYGHPIGDGVLREVAQRLRASLPDDCFVGRLGGDEFAILVPNTDHEDVVLELMSDLVFELNKPISTSDGFRTTVGGTVGVAFYPCAAQTAARLFECADFALYYAKQNLRGRAIVYTQEHEEIVREVATLSQRLRDANLGDELYVEFQPIISAFDESVVGFEALARWNSPVLGKVSPEYFIRSAEQAGIISSLTMILLDKALDAMLEWPDQVQLSFNLSTFDVYSSEAVATIVDLVTASGIAPNRICFEITETAIIQDFDKAKASLLTLRDHGFRLALDDFGTGYSSLSHLLDLPIDRVKIDKSFLQNVNERKDARHIVTTVIELCKNLKLDCIAEGIETEQQLGVVRAAGCAHIQGYYFAKPLGRSQALDYITAVSHRLSATAG